MDLEIASFQELTTNPGKAEQVLGTQEPTLKCPGSSPGSTPNAHFLLICTPELGADGSGCDCHPQRRLRLSFGLLASVDSTFRRTDPQRNLSVCLVNTVRVNTRPASKRRYNAGAARPPEPCLHSPLAQAE